MDIRRWQLLLEIKFSERIPIIIEDLTFRIVNECTEGES